MKFLLHLHLYYLDQTDYLCQTLAIVKEYGNYDLYITMQQADSKVEALVKNYFLSAKFVIVKNVGADVWPFIYVLQQVNLDNYDYIVKLHSKRFVEGRYGSINNGFAKTTGWRWRTMLLNFLKPKNFKKTVETFNKRPTLGMVGDYRLIVDNQSYSSPVVMTWRNKSIIEFMGYKQTKKEWHIGGTMFMARAKLFLPIKNLPLTEDDFVPFQSGITGTSTTYIFEVVFGACVVAQGYTINDVFTNRLVVLFTRTCHLGKLLLKLFLPPITYKLPKWIIRKLIKN
jgi:hypothetical protein